MADIKTRLDENIDKAIQLAESVGYVLVATSDADGWPHVAAARRIQARKDSRIDVTEWFCPGTMSNLQKNPHVSVVVWDARTDSGYQLLGEMQQMTDFGMIDGYMPNMERKWPMPQIESQLVIQVAKVTDFKRAPHTDIPE